uniref:MFS transporter n=1 Tax=Fusobacterium sp. TaxID=68766 RepID=UPI00260CEDDA
GVNIPYGAMASAITDKPDERQSLITFRAIGAYIGEFIVGFFGPLVIYERVINNGATQVLIRNNGNIFPMMAGGISVIALICYYICYTCTTERIKVPPLPKGEGISFFKSVKMIFSNRAMIGILGGTVCLIFGNLLTGGVNAYLYAYYFKMPAALSTYNAIKLGIALGMATVVTFIVKKLGKREAISLAVGFAALVFAVLSFLHVKNPWVYVSVASIGFSGVTFFGYVIWGAIIDVIDDAEIKSGKREDGTLYAIYSFSRKVGQALGSSLVGYALAIIGFQAGVKEQTQEVLDGIYRLATVAPATLFSLVVVMFMLVYPLSKKKVDANAETLRARREAAEKRMTNN